MEHIHRGNRSKILHTKVSKVIVWFGELCPMGYVVIVTRIKSFSLARILLNVFGIMVKVQFS